MQNCKKNLQKQERSIVQKNYGVNSFYVCITEKDGVPKTQKFLK